MKTVNSIKDLKGHLAQERLKTKHIGFVPTMGALHDGHLSLVKHCVDENEVCVTSIFVNPTQFDDKNDLTTYPRTLDKDSALLETAGCNYLFAPSEKEMYPEPDTREFDFGNLACVMEGVHRPGHFNGVAQIVSKLFYAVGPCKAYFGEKDFQQIAIIQAMVERLNLNVEIVPCPILREADGLAMSSRNVRLTAQERTQAPRIAQTLKESAALAPDKTVRQVRDFVTHTLNNEPLLHVEYFEIADRHTLMPIDRWTDTTRPIGCIAVCCGNVRLIDNIMYNV
ncbi:MAG: pantoate--beta-alanine ligase [Tannerellaceae bacterium]|jgi:pantoate--beta-alanine ligase|nr:pantoate--beta-alanine ligase [Tannerellaceae bacterium]